VGSAKLIVCALRSLLGWLHLTGILPTSLAAAVPSVAGGGCPVCRKLWSPLSCVGCSALVTGARRPVGVTTRSCCCSRLGLRTGEVAGLGLGDIDWRRGELAIVGKGNRVERLPLPADVGAAIAANLRHGRPGTAEGRSVFIRVHAPHHGLTSGG
jgi:integrase/recombinase XerD